MRKAPCYYLIVQYEITYEKRSISLFKVQYNYSVRRESESSSVLNDVMQYNVLCVE